MNAYRFWGLLIVLGQVLCGISTGPAFAQTSPGSSAVPDQLNREVERIQEQEAERQRVREQELRDAQVAPPAGSESTLLEEAKSEGGQCIAINTVNINGLVHYQRSDFASDLAPLTGACVNIDAINAVLRVITNRYISDGYVTSRAVVGPQDLQDGVLDIAVIEGSVSAIEPDEGSYGKSTLGMAFPGLSGKILNLRAFEQGVDQLSRLPSAEPNIDIVPGEQQGDSKVVISRKRLAGPLRPNASLNNDGSLATGRIQSNIGLDADNILGLADFWSLYFTRAIEGDEFKGSKGFGGFVSVPYGFWTVSLSGGRFAYESLLEGNGLSFSNTGRSWNGSLIVDRMLFRDAKTKLSVSGTLAVLDTENRIQGIRLSTSSYRLVTGAIDWRLQRKMGQGLATATIGLTRGLNILGANAVDAGPGGPRLSFRNLEASLGYQQKFKMLGIPTSYSGLIRAQSALDPVFSGQRFSLGGSSTVRGFRDDGISGRHGVFTRQQIEFPLFALFAKNEFLKSGITTFVGYDAGGIVSRGNDKFERGFMHSSTLGLKLRHKNMQGELSASTPLSAPSFVKYRDVELAASIRVGF